MNTLFGARTNWGKSYCSQAYIERNTDEVDLVFAVDYDDEYTGLVETGIMKRLTVPPETTALDVDDWHALIDANGSMQLARDGCTDEQWREIIATFVQTLSERSESVFVALDESHRLAPQRGDYPDAIDTLATTWHGDGMLVVWITQRMAKLDKDIVTQTQASMLGGFGDGADLDQVAAAIEYPKAVHKADAERCHRTLPEALQIDGEPLTLRRFTDDEGNTIGSEWIYSDDTTLRRENSQDWPVKATHYGKDRMRIKHPFE